MSMKKARQGRANARQISAMLDYIEQHPYIQSNKFMGMHGKDKLNGSWNELAELLNSLATDGKSKDVKSWKVTWRDHKTKVSDKMRKLRQKRSETGNNPIDIILNDQDKRILGLLGNEYVTGNDSCPDSFPKEHSSVLEELARGETEVYETSPRPVDTYKEEPEQFMYVEALEDAFLDVGRVNEATHLQPNLTTERNEIDKKKIYRKRMSVEQQDILRSSTKRSFAAMMENEQDEHLRPVDSEPVPSTSRGVEEKRIKPSLGTKRIRQERLGVQFANARSDFSNIANKHASAMETFAESAKIQANAMVAIGDALKIQAETASRIAETMEQQTAVIEQLATIVQSVVNNKKT